LIDKLDFKVCKETLKQDPLISKFLKDKHDSSKHTKDNYTSFRIALTSGFYFNCARRVANSPTDYILIAEGQIVSLDPSSALAIREVYPETVVFTELGGTSVARGIMRIVSEVEYSWAKNYLDKMKNVNMQRLAGL